MKPVTAKDLEEIVGLMEAVLKTRETPKLKEELERVCNLLAKALSPKNAYLAFRLEGKVITIEEMAQEDGSSEFSTLAKKLKEVVHTAISPEKKKTPPAQRITELNGKDLDALSRELPEEIFHYPVDAENREFLAGYHGLVPSFENL
jgi:hypothetical protein